MGNLQGKFPQSLAYCLPLAAAGGVMEVFATALLAHAEARAKIGKEWSPPRQKLALAGNVVLQITASMFGNLLAPWFGPVSQVGTFFMAAQLLANMVIFGWVLGLESFDKDMKIGTYVVTVAVLLLLSVGPSTQDGQDIMGLLGRWYSAAWCSLLVAGMAVSLVFLLLGVKRLRMTFRIAVLLAARATAFTVNLTVSRVMVSRPSPAYLIASIVLKIASGAVMTYAIVIQSTAVPQAKFVPLNASTIILMNALTGVVVWEDWRTIVGADWLGYACVFVLIFLGNYLLLGEVQFLDPANERFGRRELLRRMRARRDIFVTNHSPEGGGGGQRPETS